MILAHLADLHLGYRAYHRIVPGGVNARERDVADAFRAAVDAVVSLRPDVVLVAGDVFHAVRPPNAAIAEAFRQFARLRAALPDAPVVVISGNHDSPRSVETGSILRLLSEIEGVTVVEDGARAVRLDRLDLSVFCVPHAALRGERVPWEPDPGAATNVLMAHGTVTGDAVRGKLRFLGEYGAADLTLEELRPEAWAYVALGHYHIATELAPNVWYAGGTERTTSNIWEEASGEKGFLTHDTATGRTRFHPLPTRAVIDLPRLSARGINAAELDARIRAAVEAVPGGIADRIVRLVVDNVPRDLLRDLDHRRLRAYRAEALHFHFDARRPEVPPAMGAAAAEPHRTLEEELEAFLRGRWEATTSSIERERLVRLALGYLAEAGPTADDEEGLEPLAPSSEPS